MIMDDEYKECDYSDRLVAFLDILGFKQLIQGDKASTMRSINFIDGRIKRVLSILHEQHGKTFSTKLFSDCICVSCEYSSENVFSIIYELAFIQLYFSLEGIFLRGALSRGNHFENERMIFSQGLIAAYELERSARYPRIIVDKDIVEKITVDDRLYHPYYIGFKKRDFLIGAPDGCFFIDYLNLLLKEEGFEQMESMGDHKARILNNVSSNFGNVSVLEKYRWLAEYHNFKFKFFFDAHDFEDEYADHVINVASIDLQAVFPQFQKSLGNQSADKAITI